MLTRYPIRVATDFVRPAPGIVPERAGCEDSNSSCAAIGEGDSEPSGCHTLADGLVQCGKSLFVNIRRQS